MPLTIPPFVAYQGAILPIAGRWNNRPPEGDMFVPIEIDWGVTAPAGQAVQITLAGGPVIVSQIVALSVDNGRNGGDVSFIFPDTGRQLTVPAYSQGVYPVFTNSLTFYVVSEGATTGDMTEFEVLNSMPPPVSVLPSQEQSHAGVSGVDMSVNGFTQVIPAGTSGTVQSFFMNFALNNTGSGAASVEVALVDGTGAPLWIITLPVQGDAVSTLPITQTGLRLRFTNGVRVQIINSTYPADASLLVANLYYSVP